MDLTAMQAAYWTGRDWKGPGGGVSAHLHTEFQPQGLEPPRLDRAVRALFRRHPMLRLRVTAAGQQVIQPLDDRHALRIEDLRTLAPDQVQARLAATRRRMTHQRLDIASGEAAEFLLSLLPGDEQRLHVDLDMIAADPSCFGLVMDDLARFYEDPAGIAAVEEPEGCYFDYLGRLPPDSATEAADRDWWRARLRGMPPAPSLPLRDAAPAPESTRISALLPPAQAAALRGLARELRVTQTALYLAVFAAVLARATGDRAFRLTLPGFFRAPVMRGASRLVGDFTNILPLGLRVGQEATLAGLARETGREIAEALSHQACPGVAVLREMSRGGQDMESAPVVFTSGLDLDGAQRQLLSPRVGRLFGRLVWSVSQAPQVALDVQVASLAEGVLLNWDLRLDALPGDWVRTGFDACHAALCWLADAPDLAAAPLSDWLPAPMRMRRLGELQKAYLLGREAELPLGRTAMQEYRCYRGPLDAEALALRAKALIERHEALRCRLDPEYSALRVLDEAEPPLERIDLSDMGADEAEARLAALQDEFARAPLPLDGLLWRLVLVEMPQPRDQALLVKMDALPLDGAGIAQVVAELLAPELPPACALPAPPLEQADRAADAAWWRARLVGVEGPPCLPWRQPLDGIDRPRWRRDSRRIPRDQLARLARLAAARKLTRNSIAMAVVLEVLARWTPDLAPCVAVPVAPPPGGALANRSSFVAVDYRADRGSFLVHARRLQEDLLEGMAHPGLSGIGLSRLLLSQMGGQIALPVVLTNGMGWDRVPADAGLRLVDGLVQTPQVALDLRLALDADGALLLQADHVEQALDPAVVGALLDAATRAFAALAGRDELTLVGADFLPPPPAAPDGAEHAGPGHLERIAAQLFDGDPDRTALICDTRSISYGALGLRVRRVMAGLAARGLAPGDAVAICLPRGPEHLVLTLTCALSGLVWVPIDAASPPERRDYLLRNSAPRLVVAGTDLPGWLTASPQGLEAHEPAPIPQGLAALCRSEAAAYYLYTSGTTGRPKCVVLNNRATANVIGYTLDAWGIGAEDAVISVTPLHHDMSVFDLFGTLAAGARLVMPAPAEEKDAVAWNRLVREHGVTVWCSVPAIVEMLLACAPDDGLASLRLVAQGGDYIKPAVIDRLRRLRPDAALWSLGGPTETTIWSIWHRIGPEDDRVIPYGRALRGNRYLLLNPQGEPCPEGVAGRIHTSGVNLALGYLRDGALEQTDFTEVGGIRAFRSGDLGRLRGDGTILFDSRVNGYVKVRGVRISLADVEAELAAHPTVAQALVVDLPDARGETVLAALVAGRDLPEPAALRAFLRERLPQSHLPDRILAIPALPLSANGKPDRRRARQIAGQPGPGPVLAPKVPADEPADALTGLILAAFREALGAPGMGPEDDFFDHGGHSLVATRIIGRLQAEHGIALRFTDIFRHPTALALAGIATRSAPAAPMPAAGDDAAEPQAAPLSLAQQSLWKAYAAFGYGGIFNLPFALRFPTPVDEAVFGLAFGDLIRRHPVLRNHFREENGAPLQEVVPVERLGDYRWFWTSAEAGDANRRTEAGHVFDLARELPLRLRFFREGDEQVLSMLFHHIVLDEWSLNLLMDQLGHAYRQRAAGLAPEWPDQPPGFHRFAAAQRAADTGRAHLDYWLDHLRGAPRARPILGAAPGGQDPQGGWTRIDLPAALARGLYATARRNAASLFATAYAAIGAALGRLGGIDDLVIGTSASGRNDPAWFDTVGYFTTMTAHRLALGAQDTPAALIAQVRDRIARSLPHSEVPLDLVGEALTGNPVTRLDEMFEVFIQIHAQNRMNGAIELMDGSRVEYRQIDPDKAESLLGLQFEIVEDVTAETAGLRIMLSHRADRYGPAEIRRITAAVEAMLARFAQPRDDQPLDACEASPRCAASVSPA